VDATTNCLAPAYGSFTAARSKAHAADRIITLDVLKGMMLVLMAINHVPSPIHKYTSQPFGYVSAAEGFIFISALLLGIIMRKRSASINDHLMNKYIWKRVGKIYCCHISMVLFAFLFAGNILGYIQSYNNLVRTFCENPTSATLAAVFLLYQPPLMDILPMYIFFLSVTPLARKISKKWGWKTVFFMSFTIWLAAQAGLPERLLDLMRRTFLIEMGMFDLFSWQLIWILGLAIGHCYNESWFNTRFAAVALCFCVGFSLLMFAFRWPSTFISLDVDKYCWTIDKWKLGPLRLLNFIAIVYILASLNLKQLFTKALFRPFALIGKNSLTAFSVHVGFCILCLGAIEYFLLDAVAVNFVIVLQLLLIYFVVLIFDLYKSNQLYRPFLSKLLNT
jgi:hypothetical protein